MAIKKSTEIISIQKTASVGDLSDVITKIRFSRIGVDGDHTARMNGMVELPDPDSENFIAIPELTEAKAIEWVEANHNMDHFDSVVAEKIERLAGNVELPWAPVPEEPAAEEVVEEEEAPAEEEEATEEDPA